MEQLPTPYVPTSLITEADGVLVLVLAPEPHSRSIQRIHRIARQHGRVSSSWLDRPRVLVVEDEAALRTMLAELLRGDGYHVEEAADGHRGLHLGLTSRYDVLLLDRRLPAVDGLDLLARLRAHGIVTPVLVLSAHAEPADRVAGLDAGAEDYLGKPFDVDELLARLRALRRRHLDHARSLPIGEGRLDLDARLVTVPGCGEGVRLSERECTLLATLAGRPAQVYPRSDLAAIVFPDAGSEIVVDTYVHYLRRKLGRGIVATVRGRGYQLGRL